MKLFNTVWRKYQRIFAALSFIACVAALIALKPIDDKKEEMVVLGTPYGEAAIWLYDETPLHKANFLKLVEEGYYDGLLFHRVIEGFMIQGGDPDSRNSTVNQQLGRGGPGYTVPAEIRPEFIHKKGALAAARQADQVNPTRESSGSQFYIVHGAPVSASRLTNGNGGAGYSEAQIEAYTSLGGTPHLDGAYTVFGEVVEGMAVIDSIAAQKTDRANRPIADIPMTLKIVKKKWR